MLEKDVENRFNSTELFDNLMVINRSNSNLSSLLSNDIKILLIILEIKELRFINQISNIILYT